MVQIPTYQTEYALSFLYLVLCWHTPNTTTSSLLHQNGWTALYIAAAKGYLEAANTLLAFQRSPSDINVRNTVCHIFL